MKIKISVLISLALFLFSACSGAAPVAGPTSTTVTTAQPANSPVEFVWSMTGGPKPFNIPDGIAVDQQGNLYVADSLNNRIQKFDSDGQFITLWGSYGTGDGQFKCLDYCMVAVDRSGNVYVTDNDNDRIQKFDSNGKFLAKWGSSGAGDGQFRHPFGLAVDQQGHVYVGDIGNSRIQKFDGNGKFLAKWGSPGNEPGQFSSDLAEVAVDAQGNIYVSDRSNGLSKFDNNGQFLAEWSNCGDDKPIHSATGLAVDSQDQLYVYDLSNFRICKFDANGRFLNWWDGSGSADGKFSLGGGLAVDQQANVYLAEPFVRRIRKFHQQ